MVKKKPTSTQKFLPVEEIRDGVIVLKDGSMRTVLMVNAINFNLKSRDEQDALLANYQNFINSLSFPVQIVVQSRTLDLDKYLSDLNTKVASQSNALLRNQTQDYIEFVRELIGVANIMSKTFYVVIPYSLTPIAKGFWSSLFGGSQGNIPTGKKFEDAKTKIIEQTQLTSSGLTSLGLSNIQLNTQEVIELLYSSYNIDTSRRQKLFSVSNVDIAAIESIKNSEQ
ncbi:MAG: hypothetical protein PHR51_01790 [Patescibacteria group bacterium]|nr:hypothetical protein [Patescibacteria group bacterium]